MKQILKRGTKEIITCKSCGCVFSYEKEDVFEKDLDNYKAFKRYTICPQCECEVVLMQTKGL